MIPSASTSSFTAYPSTNWVVQKFGGTSVGKFPEKICDDIVKVYKQQKGNDVAVVCSARSTHTKSEGTTTRLLLAADYAADLKEDEFMSVLQLIEDDHVKNAQAKIKSKAIQDQLIEESKQEVHEVRRLLNACCVIGEISNRVGDIVMACGEKLSCRFMSALLQDRGLPAEYLDLSGIIPSDYKLENTDSLDAAFYKFLSDAIAAKISELPAGVVPVLTGFFGIVPGGLLSAVGRGYTDLCAALCAVGLNADELQIWKEVDGIFTADPRKVKNARLLKSVTPEEAAELTYYGSEVIHPFTMEQVIKAKIPIRIKNVENPNGEGTIIYPENTSNKEPLLKI
ncbi:unnamed protein product [Ambrosiozyma monospora]|uniref:Unnamed protein product n=1 Tax=Ambrosiozyma monospora TaxID=43982 RepID=A0ACB5TSA1_AMBMO|nr:unnamed protein product [Ambrosiozyma monospora]